MKHTRFNPQGLVAIKPQAYGVQAYFDAEPVRAFRELGAAAIVDIQGPLSHHAEAWFDSYDSIKDRVAKALASSAKVVVLNIDSPGGLVAGVYDTAREIRQLAAKAGKALWTYIDGEACSAAYALACTSDRVFIPESGITGSIGVIGMLVDCTEADKLWGMSYGVVSSGNRKADGNPHAGITPESLAAAQLTVDAQAQIFFDLVSEFRGVSPKIVQGFEARLFVGAQALDAKLADEIATFDQVLAKAATFTGGPATASSPTPKANSVSQSAHTQATRSIAMDFEEIKKALAKLAEDDTDEGKKAKKCLAALDEEKPADDKKDAKAEDEKPADEKKEAKAEEETPAEKKDEEKQEEDKAASAGLALSARVQALESEISAKKDTEARAALFASRPDLSPEVVKFLETQSTAVVREACEGKTKLPLGPGRPHPAAAAQSDVRPTVGQDVRNTGALVGQAHVQSDREKLDERMGIRTSASTITFDGITHTTGLMTREQAQEFLAARKKAAQK